MKHYSSQLFPISWGNYEWTSIAIKKQYDFITTICVSKRVIQEKHLKFYDFWGTQLWTILIYILNCVKC